MKKEDLTEIKTRHDAAWKELEKLCKGDRRFTMSIPVMADDTDEVLGNSLNDIPRLLAEIERLKCDSAHNESDQIGLSHLVDERDKEIERLREALGFYAAEENYRVHSLPKPPHVFIRTEGPAITMDQGAFAREALGASLG